MEKTFKITYILPLGNNRCGNIKGVTLVEASDRNMASYKFKQMGIEFVVIEKIEEVK